MVSRPSISGPPAGGIHMVGVRLSSAQFAAHSAVLGPARVFRDDGVEQARLDRRVIAHGMRAARRGQRAIGLGIELVARLPGRRDPGVEVLRRRGEYLEMLVGEAGAAVL